MDRRAAQGRLVQDFTEALTDWRGGLQAALAGWRAANDRMGELDALLARVVRNSPRLAPRVWAGLGRWGWLTATADGWAVPGLPQVEAALREWMGDNGR